ncbi:Monocarboxylate 2-oxoacid-binding periplasmic protein [subsurface metagenome]
MRKKTLLIPLALLLAASLVACAAPTPAPAPAPAPEVINWKLQTYEPAGSVGFKQTTKIADWVAAASDGRLKIEVFSGGAVVPEGEELQGVDKGVLEAACSSPAYHLKLFPQANLFAGMCGGLTCAQLALWFEDGGGTELAERMYEPLNVKLIGTRVNTGETWAMSNVRLESLSDLEGWKFRTAGDSGEVFASMGVATTFIPGGETYQAMETGVIDACEYGSPSTNWSMAFHEVSKYHYMSPSRLPGTADHFFVNGDVWAELPLDLQEIVKLAIDRMLMTNWSDRVYLDSIYLIKTADYGVEILPLPRDIEDAVLRQADIFYGEKGAGDPFYAEILESIRETRRICEEQGIR